VTGTFTTVDLDSTEKLAVRITTEIYAAGRIDADEFERRISAIIGLHGQEERHRVLHTDDVVDITYFGSPAPLATATAWMWPS
jgi:hypothetical protein